MELINATRMVAGYNMGIEPSGRELLVVVIKGTFHLPRTPDESLRLHEQQLPLIMADTFTGEPGFSAPVYEVDFAPRKKRVDVLLNGSAYAPDGRPTTRVPVGLQVNGISKRFTVVGNRHWSTGIAGVSASDLESFTVMPITYDRAYGGVDNKHEDPTKHAAYMRNPVGRGFHKHLKSDWVDGAPLPNTEESNRPVTSTDADYAPMSFGPIGRGWDPRYRYAGTYDDKWLEEHFPFLPPDFDEQYYQAAPLDQQFEGALGGQEVALVNLTPDGQRHFTLPVFEAPVYFFPKKGERENLTATLDTIVFEPDLDRFTMAWRTVRPLRRDLHDIAQVVVGRKGCEWWQQREQVAIMAPMPIAAAAQHSMPVAMKAL